MKDGEQKEFKFDYNAVTKGKHLEQNIRLEPGDIIIVPSAGSPGTSKAAGGFFDLAYAHLQNPLTISRRPPDIEDYIDMFRRYRSWILAPMFLGLVSSVVIAFLARHVCFSGRHAYHPATGTQKLVPSVLNSQMTGAALSSMQTDILSRSSLAEIIQKPSRTCLRRNAPDCLWKMSWRKCASTSASSSSATHQAAWTAANSHRLSPSRSLMSIATRRRR